jgi:protein MpaA
MLREKMSQLFSYALLFQMLITGTAIAAEKQKTQGQDSLSSFCENRLEALPGKYNKKAISQICSKVAKLESCHSVNGHPIFHYDSTSNFPTIGKKVLVLSVVHGDELEGGSVARRWNERLLDIDSRNTWRIIPILNPDGMDMKKRVNARGVDLNRNFPSNDWEELAIKYWKEKKNQDPRRYPGSIAGSEPETKCAMAHMDDFKPDFIVSIHTPYGVLDFDGPRVTVPKFKNLPWVRLGTFPGSLGRYMWKDKNVPVLTVELKDASLLENLEDVDFLQDITGTVAMKAAKETRRTVKD